ncbi:MAG: outer membrane beta-barrel protein [Ignavibacteriae bacterium]|nr:outer membrane beta-barrel protein [Ignavibacteriota bacterium]
MKKLVILLLLSFAAAYSQTKIAIESGLGSGFLSNVPIPGDPRASTVHMSYSDGETAGLVSYTIGSYVRHTSSRWGMDLGIRFLHTGGKEKTAYATGTITQNFVSIPVRGRYYWLDSPRMYVLTGAEMAFLVSSRSQGTLNSYPGGNHDRDITPLVSTPNLLLNAGVGYDFEVSGMTAYAQLLYTHSVFDTRESSRPGARWITRDISFAIGVCL